MAIVKLFAQARTLAGVGEIAIDLPTDARAADVAQALIASCPALAELLPIARVAVNRQFAALDVAIGPGDEIAIIPPVSGG